MKGYINFEDLENIVEEYKKAHRHDYQSSNVKIAIDTILYKVKSKTQSVDVVDEEILDRLAAQYAMCNQIAYPREVVEVAFKAGYRKAKEE